MAPSQGNSVPRSTYPKVDCTRRRAVSHFVVADTVGRACLLPPGWRPFALQVYNGSTASLFSVRPALGVGLADHGYGHCACARPYAF